METLDAILTTFTTTLRSGTQILLALTIPILTICATIAYYREYGTVVMSSGGGLGETLGALLTFVISVGVFYWILFNWPAMTDGALETVQYWAGLVSDGPATAELLARPSDVWRQGLAAAKPIADFDNWFKAIASLANFLVSPRDTIIFALVCIAFFALTAHFTMLVIEFHLCVMVGCVLVPWAIWSATLSLGELALGWLLGSLVRLFVSCIMVGIGLPLLRALSPAPAASPFSLAVDGQWQAAVQALGLNIIGVPQVTQVLDTFVFLGGAILFCLLCITLPSRASRLASVGLDFSGHMLMSAAMTSTRFAMAANGAIRGTSRLLAAR